MESEWRDVRFGELLKFVTAFRAQRTRSRHQDRQMGAFAHPRRGPADGGSVTDSTGSESRPAVVARSGRQGADKCRHSRGLDGPKRVRSLDHPGLAPTSASGATPKRRSSVLVLLQLARPAGSGLTRSPQLRSSCNSASTSAVAAPSRSDSPSSAYRWNPRPSRRQDRAEPPHEPDPRVDGPCPLQVLVRRLRPRPRQSRRPRPRSTNISTSLFPESLWDSGSW